MSENWQIWALLAAAVVVGFFWLWDTMRDFWSVVKLPFDIVFGWFNLRRLKREQEELERIQDEARK